MDGIGNPCRKLWGDRHSEDLRGILSLSSHGNAIGLLIAALGEASFGFKQWAEMSRPALYRLECGDPRTRVDRSFQWKLP